MIRAETQTQLVRVDDGDTPEITASKTGNTTSIQVDGITVATISDGEDGNDSSITVSKSGNTATIVAISGDGTQTTTTINDGEDGADGSDGADGKSAYESAVDGGYTGTEATFNTDLAEVSEKAPLTIIREFSGGVLVAKIGNATGALVNASGSFDIVNLTWSGDIPTITSTPSSFGTDVQIGAEDGAKLFLTNQGINAEKADGSPYFDIGVSDPVIKTLSENDTNSISYDEYFYLHCMILSGRESSEKFQQIYLDVPVGDTFNLQAKITGVGSSGLFEYSWDADFTKSYDNTQQWTSSDGICTITYSHPSYVAFNIAWFQIDDTALTAAQGAYSLDSNALVGITADLEVVDATYAFGTNIISNKMLGFAVGTGTVASEGSFVCGRYNKCDENNEKAFIIGGGSKTDLLSAPPRKNLFTVDWDGTITSRWKNADNLPLAEISGFAYDIPLFDIIYPKGSYYETSLPPTVLIPTFDNFGLTWFDPNYAWGGTWVLETEGLFHVSGSKTGSYTINGANQNDGAGAKDGGAETVALTAAQTGIRNHTHTYSDYNTTYTLKTTNRKPGTSTAVAYGTGLTAGGGATTRTSNNPAAEASGAAHENRPPYVCVYRWHRVA